MLTPFVKYISWHSNKHLAIEINDGFFANWFFFTSVFLTSKIKKTVLIAEASLVTLRLLDHIFFVCLPRKLAEVRICNRPVTRKKMTLFTDLSYISRWKSLLDQKNVGRWGDCQKMPYLAIGENIRPKRKQMWTKDVNLGSDTSGKPIFQKVLQN